VLLGPAVAPGSVGESGSLPTFERNGSLARRAPARRLTVTAAGRALVRRIDQACDGGYRSLLRAPAEAQRGPVPEALELLGGAMRRRRRDGRTPVRQAQ